MKKLLALLVLLCLCCTMVACGNKTDDSSNASKTPCEDYLWNDFTNQGTIFKTDWLIYSWTKNNLDAFKNPASVEFTGNAYYHGDYSSGDIEFFLVEYRADNSFGGKTVSYMKLTEFSLTGTDDWAPTFISPSYEGKSIYKCEVSSPTKDALEEYQDLNY